jgi:hypothetical protein
MTNAWIWILGAGLIYACTVWGGLALWFAFSLLAMLPLVAQIVLGIVVAFFILREVGAALDIY